MAVYTNLNNNDFIEILKNFSIGEYVSHTEISEGVSNSNYILNTSLGKYIFTVLEERTDTTNLEFFDKILSTLKNKKFNAPTYVNNNCGEFYSTLNINNANKIFTISTFLIGKSIEIKNIKENECYLAGKNLAKLHLYCKNIPLAKKNTMNSCQWKNSTDEIKQNINEIKPGIYQFIIDEIKNFENGVNENLPVGVIHGDYFPDNIFFHNETVSGTIDFYYSCNDYYIYDIAIGVNAFCNQNYKSIDIEKAKHFLKGYESIRHITPEEKKCFNNFLKGASLRYLTSRCYDFFHIGGETRLKYNPIEYYNILKYHIDFDITNWVFEKRG